MLAPGGWLLANRQARTSLNSTTDTPYRTGGVRDHAERLGSYRGGVEDLSFLDDVPDGLFRIGQVEAAARWASVTGDERVGAAVDAAGARIVDQYPLHGSKDWWPVCVWRWPGLPRLTWERKAGGAALLGREMRRWVPSLGEAGERLPAWAEPLLSGRRLPWLSLRSLSAFDPNVPVRVDPSISVPVRGDG